MKKSLSLLVAIAMVFSMFATIVSAAPAEGQSAGEYLKELNVIKGDENGNLNEDEGLKRQDAVVLVARLVLGLDGADELIEEDAEHGFEDVRGDYYNSVIAWAVEEGLINGIDETTFGFDEAVTAQQFATIVLRALGYTIGGEEADYEYADVVEAAVEAGLLPEGTENRSEPTRGDVYGVIVIALDTEVSGTGKTLGNLLGLKGYEILEIAAVSASAPARHAVVVNFNSEVGAAVANNFSIHEKDNQYAVVVIENIDIAGDRVTLNTIDALQTDKEYVVVVNAVPSKDNDSVSATVSFEFNFVKQEAVSIGFATTTVKKGDPVRVVVKDANSNDITSNYTVGDQITVETSNSDVVKTDLTTDLLGGATSAFAVVNVKLKDGDTELATDNTIINVRDTLDVATSIGRVSLSPSGDFANAKLELFQNTVGERLIAEVLNQSGGAISPADVTYRSLNPAVLVVDEYEGFVYPVKEGTASVLLTAQFGNSKVTKTVTVTVKANAKATTLSADKTSVRIVEDSNIPHTVEIKVLDQYGNVLEGATDAITYEWTGSTDVALPTVPTNLVNGKAEIVLTEGTAKGTNTLKIKAAGLERTISVSLVTAGAFAGYVAVADGTTLDLDAPADTDKKQGELTSGIKVYERDVNGNYIKEVTTDISLSVADENVVSVSDPGDPLVVTAEGKGTKAVAVKVGSTTISNITFTVVNSARSVTKVSQVYNAITVNAGDDVFAALFGTSSNGAAFVAYDQYGDKIQVARTEVQGFTSNGAVVSAANISGALYLEAEADPAGDSTKNATLTINVNDTIYTVTVKVVTP